MDYQKPVSIQAFSEKINHVTSLLATTQKLDLVALQNVAGLLIAAGQELRHLQKNLKVHLWAPDESDDIAVLQAFLSVALMGVYNCMTELNQDQLEQ